MSLIVPSVLVGMVLARLGRVLITPGFVPVCDGSQSGGIALCGSVFGRHPLWGFCPPPSWLHTQKTAVGLRTCLPAYATRFVRKKLSENQWNLYNCLCDEWCSPQDGPKWWRGVWLLTTGSCWDVTAKFRPLPRTLILAWMGLRESVREISDRLGLVVIAVLVWGSRVLACVLSPGSQLNWRTSSSRLGADVLSRLCLLCEVARLPPRKGWEDFNFSWVWRILSLSMSLVEWICLILSRTRWFSALVLNLVRLVSLAGGFQVQAPRCYSGLSASKVELKMVSVVRQLP